jgi:hypothetical protein
LPSFSELAGSTLASPAFLLVRPGAISLGSAAPLLSGLETAGPYMFLIAGVAAGLIAWGLTRRSNLARRAAIVIAIAGIAALVPSVSGAAMMVQPRALLLGSLGVILRVIIAWSLLRSEVVQEFTDKAYMKHEG